jgi:hypothetical protein
MCSQVTCPQCKKPDWRGCGAHVEQLLGHIAKKDRCACREAPPRPKERDAKREPPSGGS